MAGHGAERLLDAGVWNVPLPLIQSASWLRSCAARFSSVRSVVAVTALTVAALRGGPPELSGVPAAGWLLSAAKSR